MRVKTQVLHEASSRTKARAACCTSGDIWHERFYTVGECPVLLCHVLFETFEFKKGARAPRTVQNSRIMSLQALYLLWVVGVVRGQGYATRNCKRKKLFGRGLR